MTGAYLDRFRARGYLREREEAIGLAGRLAEEVGQHFMVRDHITIDLIADYFWQRIRRVTETEFFDHEQEVQHYYEEEFLTNQAMIDVVEDYVESDAYNMVKRELGKANAENLKGIYDFYTDYELFSAMAQRTQADMVN